jgi:hypothetical protein
VNTQRPHLQRFCATGTSSGLTTRVTLTGEPRGRMVESIAWGGRASDFSSVPYYVIVAGLLFKWCILYLC